MAHHAGNASVTEDGAEIDEGVRDRRNRETRQRIHMMALELGEDQGIAATTVAEIAERAGVSRRTFFRYFRNKEEAVLAGHSRYLDAAGSLPLRVSQLADALVALEQIGDVVLEQEGIPELAEHRRIHALISSDAAIRAYAVAQDRVISDLFRDRLAEVLPGEELSALELIADLGVTIWRHGWVRWTAQASSENAETPEQSHLAVRSLFRKLASESALPS